MKRNYLKTLLFGALVTASAGTFVSCNYDDDIDELKNRITVVEGLITELKAAVENGLSITSATQTDGVWTLVLSNGSTIVCGGGAGGSSVTVVENADNIVITVDGKEYTLPKGAAAASLIYRPVYNDGKEIIPDMKSIPVSFLISGDVFDASKITEATIVDAYALTTRAASSLFEVVEGSAAVNGNIVTVSIKAGESAEASKTYNVNVRIKVGSKEYISNYFQIEMGDGFIYDNAAPQDQIDAFAAADGFSATVDADGAAKLLVFADELATMEGEVDFAKYFKGLPEGAKFIIGAQATEEGNKAFDALRNSMGNDGKFNWTQRPGTAFPNGFRVTVQNKESQTIGKADFKYSDPIDQSVDWIGVFASGTGGHIEIIGGDKQPYSWLPAGANDIDLQQVFAKAIEDGRENTTISPMHDGGKFIYEQYCKFSAGDYVFYDGERWALGDAGKKLAQASAGVKWVSKQISVGSSNRRNLADQRPADEGNDANIAWCGGNCNGELMWDGISAEGKVALGISLREDGHLITTEAYKGWNMRIGLWASYEYLYGEKEIGGGALVWAWVNRRCCPEGTDDSLITAAQNQ